MTVLNLSAAVMNEVIIIMVVSVFKDFQSLQDEILDKVRFELSE